MLLVVNCRSSSLSRQSTQDSDTDSTISAPGPEPIRKSPREYIIPIAVEGGGYITPRAGSLEPSVSEVSTEASRHHRSSGLFSKPRRMRYWSSIFIAVGEIIFCLVIILLEPGRRLWQCTFCAIINHVIAFLKGCFFFSLLRPVCLILKPFCTHNKFTLWKLWPVKFSIMFKCVVPKYHNEKCSINWQQRLHLTAFSVDLHVKFHQTDVYFVINTASWRD